jgi:hypothetical protein
MLLFELSERVMTLSALFADKGTRILNNIVANLEKSRGQK